MIDPTAVIHPSADIEEDVTIGPRTRVWARTHIRRGARVGADCNIGESVLIDLAVPIGDRCKIQNQVLLYHGSVIEDEVFVGPAACLTNDRIPRAATPDGHLKDIDDWVPRGVHVHHGASLGAHAVIVAGHSVGAWAMVGAGAVVAASVSDHALVVGNPAHRIAWVCCCGTRLKFDNGCPQCGRRYRERGQSGLQLIP